MLIEYVDRMSDILPINNVLVHDDWGHQRGPFFSASTGVEMIVPYMRRLTDFCHSKGMTFELHCYGKNEKNIPNMIKAGVDLWCGQLEINDFETLAEEYKDCPITFGFSPASYDPEATDEELREQARQWVLRHKDHHVAYTADMAPVAFQNAVYEFSRRLFSGETI